MSSAKLRTGVTAAAVVALLAGCTGGGAADPAAQEGDGSTLRYIIVQTEDAADLDLIEENIAEFEQANDVEVDLQALPTENLRTVLQTQLRSGNGPDVFSYDTGPGFAGVLADAGLLYDLTDAYQDKGWEIYESAKERVTFDGKVLGVPNEIEEIGIYYNKDLVPEQPQDLGELQQVLGDLQADGLTPMAFGNKEAWPAGHMLSMTLSSLVGGDGMQALLNGEKPWNSPEVVQAIETFFVDFNESGYLPQSPNAITYDDANALFYSGKAAMNPTGTWLTNEVVDTVDFPVGYMPFPAPDGSGLFTAGLGSGTFVSAKTQNPELAIELLDHLTSEEHGRWQVENFSTIPAYPVDTEGLEVSPLFAQILEDTSQLAAGEGEFGANIDVLTTEVFNKAMWEGLQAVLNGDKTPQQLADELQAAFEQSSGA